MRWTRTTGLAGRPSSEQPPPAPKSASCMPRNHPPLGVVHQHCPTAHCFAGWTKSGRTHSCRSAAAQKARRLASCLSRGGGGHVTAGVEGKPEARRHNTWLEAGMWRYCTADPANPPQTSPSLLIRLPQRCEECRFLSFSNTTLALCVCMRERESESHRERTSGGWHDAPLRALPHL